MNQNHYQHLIQYLTDWSYAPELSDDDKKKIRGQAGKYFVQNQVLYKKRKDNPQRVVKEEEVLSLVKRIHEDPTSGHFGIQHTYQRATKSYYWPQMFEDIRTHVRRCDNCQKQKNPNTSEELHPLPVQQPFDRVGIDLLQLPLTTLGNRHVIVATDYLTKWVEARAVPDKTASTVAGFIYEDIICRHGAPKELLSDQGKEFMNALVANICALFETKHQTTTPYHPQTNGLTERFNQTLIKALGKLIQQHKTSCWDELLPSVLFAYRTAKHSTTGFTPIYLMCGREATLPLEFCLPTWQMQDAKEETSQDWIKRQVQHLTLKLKQAQEQAQRNITSAQQIYKQWYDQRRQAKPEAQYKIGDQVLRKRNEVTQAPSNKLEPRMRGP